MFWVVICAVGSSIIVNLPLVYIFFRVHRASGLDSLWGYAPNQFLFPLLAFPLATFATFLAMRLLITYLQKSHTYHPILKWSAENWIVVALIAITMTSTICIVDYFFSVKTFDKLHPVYAQRAVEAAEDVRNKIMDLPKQDREEVRKKLIRSWRDEKQKIVEKVSNDNEAMAQLLDLEPGVYLQVVQDPVLQRKLNIVNPTVHALNVVQLFIALFTGFCMLFVTILCIYTFTSEPNVAQSPVMRNALNAVFFAVTFFAFFPILYAQQRSELEYLVGTGYTILPHVFSMAVIIGLLLALISLEPIKGHIPNVIMARVLPILIIIAGFGSNLVDSQPLRQVVGVESNWGIQIMLILFFYVATALVILHLLSWNVEKVDKGKGMDSRTTIESNVH